MRQLSQTLKARAPSNSIVVAVELCVSLLEEWHPPGTMQRPISRPGNEVILGVAVLVLNWKAIVDVDWDPFL